MVTMEKIKKLTITPQGEHNQKAVLVDGGWCLFDLAIIDINNKELYLTIQHNGVGQFHLIFSHIGNYKDGSNSNYKFCTEEEVMVFAELMKDYKSELKEFTLNYCNSLKESSKPYEIRG